VEVERELGDLELAPVVAQRLVGVVECGVVEVVRHGDVWMERKLRSRCTDRLPKPAGENLGRQVAGADGDEHDRRDRPERVGAVQSHAE
jgi:hypothetical protein